MTFPRRFPVETAWVLAIIVATFLLLVFAFQRRHAAAEIRWEAQVEAAESFARAERARADSAIAASDSAAARAEAAIVRATNAEVAADRIRPRRDSLLTRIAAQPVPIAAIPFTASRDSAIALLVAENASLRTALAEQQLATAALDVALVQQTAARTSLSAALDSMTALVDRRPSPRRGWMPEIGVGVFAGGCKPLPAGAPVLCWGVGPSLSWKL